MSKARNNTYIVDNLQRVLEILHEKPLKFITYNSRFNFLNIQKPLGVFELLTMNDYFYNLGMQLTSEKCPLTNYNISVQYFRCRPANAYYNTKVLDDIFGSFSYQLLSRNLCMPNLEVNSKLFDLTIRFVEARIKKHKLLMVKQNE